METVKTEQQERSDNELIAEFMGHDVSNTFRYDKYWDCLMPVVEKIEELMFQVEIFTAYTKINGELNNGIIYNQDSCFEKQSDKKIDVTYRSVLRFIKWYNGLAVNAKELKP